METNRKKIEFYWSKKIEEKYIEKFFYGKIIYDSIPIGNFPKKKSKKKF